ITTHTHSSRPYIPIHFANLYTFYVERIIRDVIIAKMAAACCVAANVKAVFLVLLSAFAAQGSSRGPCDPLTPEYCQLPWPNSFFTRPDAAAATGLRVNMSQETWPRDSTGRGVDPVEWNTMDGFSPFPSIMTYFPGLSDSGLPHHWDMETSLDITSPTIIMDFDSGEVLPHFAELDSALGVSSQNGQRETTHLATLTQRESKLGLYYNLVLFPANITLLE
ncbi:hypothetical protein GBAR_LOCUS30655, partial [Geodia barretti]